MKVEIAITLTAIVALSTLIYSGAFGMYEDQMKVCNFKDVCQIVNIDDYMTRSASDKLQNNFDKDLDTFSDSDSQNKQDYNEDILIHLDTECRDTYHSFCFGEAWNSLTEFLN